MSLFGPPNIGKLTSKKDVKGLIKALSFKEKGDSQEFYKIRTDAVIALGEIGDKSAVDPLVDLLILYNHIEYNDIFKEKENLVLAIAQALGKIGDSKAANILCSFLQMRKKTPWHLQVEFIKAISQVGDKNHIDTMYSLLRDENLKIRSAALEALEKLDFKPEEREDCLDYWIAKRQYGKYKVYNEKDLEALTNEIRVIYQDPSTPIEDKRIPYLAIAYVLKKSVPESVHEINRAILFSDKNDLGLRNQYGWILAMMGSSATEMLINWYRHASKKSYNPLHTDEESDFVYNIILQSKMAADEKSSEALMTAFEDEKDIKIQKKILELIVAFDHQVAFPFLERNLMFPDDEIRKSIIRLFDSHSYIPELSFKTLDYFLNKGQIDEIVSLGEFVVEPLLSLLESASSEEISPIFDILAKFDDPRGLESLVANIARKTTEDYDDEVIRRIIKIGSPAVPFLIKALGSAAPIARCNIIWTMSNIPEPSVIEPIMLSVIDRDERVRKLAAAQLMMIGDEALNAIEAYLTTEYKNIQTEEIKKQVGDYAAWMEPNLKTEYKTSFNDWIASRIPTNVQDYLTTKYPKIRCAALLTLARSRNKYSFSDFWQLLEEGDWIIRLSIVEFFQETSELKAIGALVKLIMSYRKSIGDDEALISEVFSLAIRLIEKYQFEKIVEIYNRVNSEVRTRLINPAFLKIGMPIVEKMTKSLGGFQVAEQKDIAEVYKALGEPALELLYQGLTSTEERERKACAVILIFANEAFALDKARKEQDNKLEIFLLETKQLLK